MKKLQGKKSKGDQKKQKSAKIKALDAKKLPKFGVLMQTEY